MMSGETNSQQDSDNQDSEGISEERAEEIVSELLTSIEDHQDKAGELDGERAAAEHGMADGMMHAVNLINSELYDEENRI